MIVDMTTAPIFDYQQVFHTGIRVPDLDAAMLELGATLGVTWATVVDNPGQGVWTPTGGAQTVPLRFTYSCEGPQHIELLEAPAGSVWSGHEQPGVHHLGVWVDDVAANVARAEASGWTCVAASTSPDDGFGAFAYVQPPSGTIVEFVWSALQPRFDQWWSGGSLS